MSIKISVHVGALVASCLLTIAGCSSAEPTANREDDHTEAERDGAAERADEDRSDDEAAADDDEMASDDRSSSSSRRDASTPDLDGAASRADGASATGGKDAESGAKDTSVGVGRDASSSSSEGGTVDGGSGSGAAPSGDDCTSLSATADYAAKGPFEDAKVFERLGPTGAYLLYRPDASLGRNGFKHPLVTWGNGIATTADQYKQLLTHVASHGFVVIACPDTQAERDCLDRGMEWLVQQNSAPGPLQGKLDVSREATVGYSWGGGAAIDTANRPNVKATVSLHGMPPRRSDAFTTMHAPLLLFTSTGDSFVSAAGYVTPNYNKSTKVPTFYATLQEDVGHLYIIDEGAVSCSVDGLLGGPCAGAAKERAPTVAFLRHFVCGDQEAKSFFFGQDCTLCTTPWKSQNKPSEAWK